MSRLDQQWPEVGRLLATQSAASRRSLALRAATAARTRWTLKDPQDDEVLAAEVKRLDELAWQVQEDAEGGRATNEQYELAFRRARAMHATLFARQGHADDAIYEALHALHESFDLTALFDETTS